MALGGIKIISLKVFLKSPCKSQFPHKSVYSFFLLVIAKGISNSKGIRYTRRWAGGPQHTAWPRPPRTWGFPYRIRGISKGIKNITQESSFSEICGVQVFGIPGSGLEALDVWLGPALLELRDPLLCEAHPATNTTVNCWNITPVNFCKIIAPNVLNKGFRESTPPQNRQLDIFIGNDKQ